MVIPRSIVSDLVDVREMKTRVYNVAEFDRQTNEILEKFTYDL